LLFLLFFDKFYQKSVSKLLYTYTLLGLIFVVPMMLYIFCVRTPDPVFDNTPFALAIANSYSFFPFVILACIGFFPLTALETVCIVTPFLTVYYLTTPAANTGPWSPDLGIIWTMGLLACASLVICYSQLHTLIQLISYSSYDLLTNCLGRRSGEEVVKALWHYSIRKKTHFAIAFIDLDHFKQVNDNYSHQAGDKVLANTALAIRQALRKNDFVIRWGGEEFLVILPDANLDNAAMVMRRVVEKGFGLRPDGSPQTVSIGIAERLAEQIGEDMTDMDMLIQIADNRLYQAKTSGRSRIVGANMEIARPHTLTAITLAK
jgi:diguanylate cyclase (GGDEF)-like protein